MKDRISAAEYLAMAKSLPMRTGGSSGRMLRLPADFQAPSKPGPASSVVPVARAAENTPATRVSSAQKARDRVGAVVAAIEAAVTDITYSITPDGDERVLIRVVGGETLPPNRAANIGREQSKMSQRAFSRYKHACADRMRDAGALLQAQVTAAGRSRFNRDCLPVQVCYGRQVVSKSRLVDEDAVVYSYKYYLDGLVAAAVLVDDSRRYVRIGEPLQKVGPEALLLIELTTLRDPV